VLPCKVRHRCYHGLATQVAPFAFLNFFFIKKKKKKDHNLLYSSSTLYSVCCVFQPIDTTMVMPRSRHTQIASSALLNFYFYFFKKKKTQIICCIQVQPGIAYPGPCVVKLEDCFTSIWVTENARYQQNSFNERTEPLKYNH
jgi:hypothetical protein